MARVSRKAAVMEQEAGIISKPERVYSTAVYARLSVEDNNRAGDRESITMQRYMLEKYVEAQADMRLSGVFCDNGETGTNFERPAFARMMADLRQGEIDCIIVKDLSRFGRAYTEAGSHIETVFPFLGVRFISIVDRYDSSDPECDKELLLLSLKNLMHEMYAKDISKKVGRI